MVGLTSLESIASIYVPEGREVVGIVFAEEFVNISMSLTQESSFIKKAGVFMIGFERIA
jgi:hypothetical protein